MHPDQKIITRLVYMFELLKKPLAEKMKISNKKGTPKSNLSAERQFGSSTSLIFQKRS